MVFVAVCQPYFCVGFGCKQYPWFSVFCSGCWGFIFLCGVLVGVRVWVLGGALVWGAWYDGFVICFLLLLEVASYVA